MKLSNKVKISAIIPVSEHDRDDDVQSLYHEYKNSLQEYGKPFELIYVVDGHFPEVIEKLSVLQKEGEDIVVIKLAKWFGEATALTAGFEQAKGEWILTLPAYQQIESAGISSLLDEMENVDMVISRRWPRIDSIINRFQSRIFNGMLKWITGSSFNDLGCSVRVFKREVMEEVSIYGDLHRFLPMLAEQKGFTVTELKVAQSSKEKFIRLHRPGVMLRRMLDMLTVFFLVKFTKKPLRFFGLIGSTTLALGGAVLLFVIGQRLFFDVPLADRPALLLSALFVVLGVQVFAMGLIGELIIFTHAKDLKEYTIEEITPGKDAE